MRKTLPRRCGVGSPRGRVCAEGRPQRRHGWSPAGVRRRSRGYERAKTGLEATRGGAAAGLLQGQGGQAAARCSALAEDPAQQKGWEETLQHCRSRTRSTSAWSTRRRNHLHRHVDVAARPAADRGLCPVHHHELRERRAGHPAGDWPAVCAPANAPPAGPGPRGPAGPVLDELILRRRIGSPAVMYEQLSRWGGAVERDNVDSNT